MAHGVAQQEQNQSQGHIREQWGQLPTEREGVSQCIPTRCVSTSWSHSGVCEWQQVPAEFYMGLYVLRPDRGLMDVCV